jgi:hypothetical protein
MANENTDNNRRYDRFHGIGRLEPAPTPIPTAAADQQHNNDNDQKSSGVHVVLLKVKRGLRFDLLQP